MEFSFLRPIIGAIASSWTARLLSFATFVATGRVLEPAEFGIFGVLLTSVVLAAAIGSMGLTRSGALQNGEDRLHPDQIFSAGMAILPPIAIVCGGLIWLAIPGIARVSIEYYNALPFVLSISVVFGGLCQGLLLGGGEIAKYNLLQLSPQLLSAVFIGISYMANSLTLSCASWSVAGAYILTGFIGLRFVQTKLTTLNLGENVAKLVSAAWPFAFVNILSALNARAGVFVALVTVGPVESGAFFAATKVMEVVLMTASSAGVVLFSFGVRVEDKSSLVNKVAHMSGLAFFACIGISLMGAILAPLGVPLLLGEKFSQTIPALEILLLSMPFSVISRILYPMLGGVGHVMFGVRAFLSLTCFNVFLALILGWEFGLTGFAGAHMLTQIVGAVAFARFSSRKYTISFSAFFWPLWVKR